MTEIWRKGNGYEKISVKDVKGKRKERDGLVCRIKQVESRLWGRNLREGKWGGERKSRDGVDSMIWKGEINRASSYGTLD